MKREQSCPYFSHWFSYSSPSSGAHLASKWTSNHLIKHCSTRQQTCARNCSKTTWRELGTWGFHSPSETAEEHLGNIRNKRYKEQAKQKHLGNIRNRRFCKSTSTHFRWSRWWQRGRVGGRRRLRKNYGKGPSGPRWFLESRKCQAIASCHLWEEALHVVGDQRCDLPINQSTWWVGGCGEDSVCAFK